MAFKERPFIMINPLYFTAFHIFSNILKTAFGPRHTSFYAEFQALSFDKKRKCFNPEDNREEILKILKARLFMSHSLQWLQSVFRKTNRLMKRIHKNSIRKLNHMNCAKLRI